MKTSFAFALIHLLTLGAFGQTDQSGCEDHAIITRYPGAVIEYCDIQVYKEYGIATGPETGYQKISDWTTIAGKLTRLYYSIKGDRTVTEVYRNYMSALGTAEFDILAQGLNGERNVAKTVGGNGWLNTFYKTNSFPPGVGIKINQGSATIGGTFHIAGRLNNVYVTISGKQYSDNEVVVLLDVIEQEDVEDNLIKVDADYMAKKLKETGRVALEGILFDTNKATIKSESEPLLAEIGKMLKANPSFKLYVVGHTDMIGDLRYNLELSAKRAPAVVNYLVEKHGIALARLSPQSAGPLAPVATNDTEEGRSKNRRVELVLTDHQLLPR
ncbi:MAG: OmpA family protein [Cyclobacteriaceae bacterium]